MNAETDIEFVESAATDAGSISPSGLLLIEHCAAKNAEMHLLVVGLFTGWTIGCGIGATRHVAIVPSS